MHFSTDILAHNFPKYPLRLGKYSNTSANRDITLFHININTNTINNSLCSIIFSII